MSFLALNKAQKISLLKEKLKELEEVETHVTDRRALLWRELDELEEDNT